MPLGRFDLGFPNRAGSDSTCWLGWRPAWMGKPYSMDLRERVVAAVETGGLSCHQAAAQFGVGVSTAIVWVRRLRETGSVAPGQMGGQKPKAISGEHRAWLLERTKAIETTPPHGHWKTTTFLAALRHDRLDAPWLFDGPIDGESFRTYVEKVLVPTLRPGDIVIMDNLGSHKAKAVRQLIRAAGAKLFFLPKYSPDLNPIEQAFAKIKHFLRKAAARSVETICTAIGEILGAFTPDECANYFQNSGYAQT